MRTIRAKVTETVTYSIAVDVEDNELDEEVLQDAVEAEFCNLTGPERDASVVRVHSRDVNIVTVPA